MHGILAQAAGICIWRCCVSIAVNTDLLARLIASPRPSSTKCFSACRGWAFLMRSGSPSSLIPRSALGEAVLARY
jgi:hypothetical protein